MTSLSLLWRSIKNSEGRINPIDDLENDQFYTKSASIVSYVNNETENMSFRKQIYVKLIFEARLSLA